MRLPKLGLSTIQLAIMLVCSTASGGWAQSHIWSTSLEGYEGDAVAVDAAGNTVIAGRYDNSVLVAKFDAAGQQLWRKLFTRGGLPGPRIALDSGGEIVITGGFSVTINFGGGVLVSAGSQDMYLAKLSGQNGGHIWSRRFGSEDLERGVGIVVDDDSNVIVTGQFDGTANFGGGNLTSAGQFDVLVAKYNAAGTHVWSKSFGSGYREQSWDVTVDELDNVIVTGSFQGSGLDFGGGPLNSAGIYDVFLAKLDANGDHLWSKSFGGPTNDSGDAVAVNENGDVSITGAFSGSVSFGGDTLTAPGNMGERDIFVAKYCADGSHVWSQRFGDEHDGQSGSGIAVDEAGDVVVTGWFYGTVNFGGEPIEAGEVDGFLAKYDANGAHLWSRRLGGAGGDYAFGTATRGEDIAIVTGRFTPPADFGGGQLTEGGIFVGAYGDSPTAVETPTQAIALRQNHPNPFNPTTTIAFVLPERTSATLAVYDVNGRIVKTLVTGVFDGGHEECQWNGTDAAGNRVSTGVYFYRLTAGNRTLTKKMVLLK